MALVKLLGGLAKGAIDHATSLHRGAQSEEVGPALNVPVLVDREKLARAVDEPLRERSVPGPHGQIGNRVLAASEVLGLGETAIENVELHYNLLAATLRSSWRSTAGSCPPREARPVVETVSARHIGNRGGGSMAISRNASK